MFFHGKCYFFVWKYHNIFNHIYFDGFLYGFCVFTIMMLHYLFLLHSTTFCFFCEMLASNTSPPNTPTQLFCSSPGLTGDLFFPWSYWRLPYSEKTHFSGQSDFYWGRHLIHVVTILITLTQKDFLLLCFKLTQFIEYKMLSL